MTIWIDNDTKLRVNIHQPYKGYSRLETPEQRAAANVVEIADDPVPADYSDDIYYRTEDWTATQRPYTTYTLKSPEQIAAVRWGKIKAKRDDLTDNGGCLVSGKWYHSDAKSKQQQMALAMVGASLPAIPWKTMDGSFVTLTPAIVGQIFQAQMAREQAIFANAEALKADLQSDIESGWPARYETAAI